MRGAARRWVEDKDQELRFGHRASELLIRHPTVGGE